MGGTYEGLDGEKRGKVWQQRWANKSRMEGLFFFFFSFSPKHEMFHLLWNVCLKSWLSRIKLFEKGLTQEWSRT